MIDSPSLLERTQAQRSRRAWVLFCSGLVIPGSAQAVYGRGRNRQVGRFALKLWLTLLALAVITGILWLLFRNAMISFFTTGWVLALLIVAAGCIVAFWFILAIDTIILARPWSLGRRRGAIFSSVAGLLTVLLILGPVVPVAYFASKATSALCNVTNGQDCNLISAVTAVGHVFNGGSPHSTIKTDANGRTNVLLLGTSDDRPDADSGTGSWLTDSIMVVSVSQSAHNAYMISIPRDLWVTYPAGCPAGTQGKVNAVYQCNGAASGNSPAQDQAALTATIPTFEDITGLQIQYAANINYSVLVSLVNAVGGSITVNVVSTDPRGIYDVNTGLTLNPNTPQCPTEATQPMICTVDAETALALARARNSDGGYGLAASNFNREQNQQAIIVGLMEQASSNGLFADLAGVTTALDGIGANLRSTFSTSEIPALMSLARDIPATSFTSLDFISANPAIVGTPMIAGQSAVAPLAGTFDYSAIQAWIATNLSSDPAAAEGATIDVLNGSGQSGIAAATASDLKALGYTIGTIGNYSDTTSNTQVYDITGNKPLTSAALAEKFGVAVTSGSPAGYEPSRQADFVVILGG